MSTGGTPRSGGRRAERAGRRSGPGARVCVAVLAVAVALVVVAGRATPPSADGTDGPVRTTRPVERTLLVCPDDASAGDLVARLRSEVRAGLAPVGAAEGGPPAPERDLELSVGALGGATDPLGLSRGELEAVGGPAPVVAGRGPAAVGLFAARTDRVRGAAATARCVAPRGTWWFAGAGAGLDHASHLVLANPDQGPAVVDLTLYGPDGPVDTVATRGLQVRPGESLSLPLAELAPQTDELLVRVAATRGRVAAAVLDRFARSAASRPGLAWLPDAERPERRLLLAGLPDRAGARTLLVANPGDRQALVDVEVAGAAGSFAPAGLGQISVAPGSVATVDVTDAVPAGEPVALRVAATVPVVASVRTAAGDSTYAGPAPALTGPAAAVLPDGARSTVQLTAGNEGSVVRLTGRTSNGEVTGRTRLRLPAGGTAGWTPSRGTGYVLAEPIRGRVAGAVSHAGPGLLAQTPLVTLPVTVTLPPVVPGP